MRCVIEVCDKKWIEDLRTLLQEWEEEHAGYYGLPCGVVRMTHSCPIGPELDTQLFAGYQQIDGGGRWLTSGGNYTAIVIKNDLQAYIWLDGRRHGLRFPFPSLEEEDVLSYDGKRYIPYRGGISTGRKCIGRVLEYQSRCPEAPPWTMGLVPLEK